MNESETPQPDARDDAVQSLYNNSHSSFVRFCSRTRSANGHGHKHAAHAFDDGAGSIPGQAIARGVHKVAVHVFDYRLDPCLVRGRARNRSFLVFRLLSRLSGFIWGGPNNCAFYPRYLMRSGDI